MKNKLFSVLCLLLILSLLAVPVWADVSSDDIQTIVDELVAQNLEKTGAGTIQAWIDGPLTENAGATSEWYIFGLSQSGNYDFSAYESALLNYLNTNTVRSASSRLKYALVLRAVGSKSDTIREILDNSIGQQGIMSWVYGLHLMNNGVACAEYTAEEVIAVLLEFQHEDGGWSLTGEFGDADVTAMTMQALALYKESNAAVKTALDNGIVFLSEKQKEDGGYTSFGQQNSESTSQVLIALSALGIDCTADDRFQKNGCTLFDAILKYRLDDGTFCHDPAKGTNHTATVQAFTSMIAYLRMTEGKAPLYILDDDQPASPESEMSEVPTEPQETETAEEKNIEIIPEAPENRGSYKPIACLILVGGGGILCLIFFLLGKRNKKNFLAIALLTGLGILIVLFTDFQTTDDYYSGNVLNKENSIGTVTLTIRCDTVAGKIDSEYIPENGVILDVTEFAIEDGDTVFDVLSEAAQAHQIHMEKSGPLDMIYVTGINYLYEFDFGDLSGWVYHVNGSPSSLSCGEYTVKDGDRIEWLYSCDLGNDLQNAE